MSFSKWYQGCGHSLTDWKYVLLSTKQPTVDNSERQIVTIVSSKMLTKFTIYLSYNGNILRVAVSFVRAGNSPGIGEFPSQRPVTRSFNVFFLICAWINGGIKNREVYDLRRHRANHDVTVMTIWGYSIAVNIQPLLSATYSQHATPDLPRDRCCDEFKFMTASLSFNMHVYVMLRATSKWRDNERDCVARLFTQPCIQT